MFAPRLPRSLISVLISTTSGIFVIFTSFLARIVLAMIGKAAFLAPLISTLPLSFAPPVICKKSIFSP